MTQDHSPHIVILDSHTTSPLPGDAAATADHPSWEPVASLGKLTIYPRTNRKDILVRAQDASIVLTNKTPLTAATLAALPKLRYVGILATGVNVIDLPAACKHGVKVANVPGYSSSSVAQHVFSLILEMLNAPAAHNEAVHRGQWTDSPDFSFTVAPLTELAGKTLGIVGVGDIGKRVATIAHALGMNIAAAHQSSMHRVNLPGIDIDWLPLDALLGKVDILSLHCPLNEQTHHLLNADRLARLKPSARIINTGRGQLIDEPALARALENQQLAGAALDVLSAEPPAADNPLLTAPNCLITPHIAWATREARARLIQIAADNIRAFLQGEPQNIVNP